MPSDFKYDCTAEVFTDARVKLSQYKSLSSGMTIWIAEVNGPMVRGYLAFGTETFDNDGLPHALKRLVFFGSEKYPYKGVVGGIADRCLCLDVNAWTDIDKTCYSVTTVGDEGFLKILPIYLDHLLFPTLTDAAFTTEIHHINGEGEDAGVLYGDLQDEENTGEKLCNYVMFRALFPGRCGYRSSASGLMENLRKNTTNERVRQYHKDFYRPENLCVIIVGQVEADKVFEALVPVEERILQEGKRSEFVRPWQLPVPPLRKSVTREVEYPEDDLQEDYGMVLASWRGPLINDHLNVTAIQILMNYFIDNSAAPLNRNFVEIEDPLSNKVYFSFMKASVTLITLIFSSVPYRRLDELKEKLLNLLRNVVEGKEAIYMEHLTTLIKKAKVDKLTSVESGPCTNIAFTLIENFLHGSTLDLKNRVNEIPLIEELFEKDAQFWIDLLKTYIVENNHVIALGSPSSELLDEMQEAEDERIDEQREKLGPEGLKEKAEILLSAIEANKVPPPNEMLTAVAIPSVKSIKFHPIKRICNVRESDDVVEYSMDKMPCRFQVDDIQTNFVRVLVMIDTSDLPLESRMHLPIFIELLLESAIKRDGTLVPYQDVVKQLDKDTLSISATMGWGSTGFCSTFAQTIYLFLMVEEEKYEKSVEWIHEILYQICIDSSRIKCIANRMIAEVRNIKRSGNAVVATMMKNLCFRPDSSHWASSVYRQHKFLIKLLKDLEANSEVVVSKLNHIRDSIFKPEKMAVHLAVNLENLKKKVEPEEVWIKKFLPPSISPAVMNSCFKKCSEYLLPMTGNPIKGLIAGLGSVETSYLLQTAVCVLTHTHPDYAKLIVLISYLTQDDGPMWWRILDRRYARSYDISLDVATGLIQFSLSDSTHLVEAYKEAVDIVNSRLNGTADWDLELLEFARCSLMCSFIQDMETISGVFSQSVSAYSCDSGMDITNEIKELLEKISMVTTTDMECVGIQYLKPLFNPELSWCAITCNPTKVKDISEQFKKLSRELTVVSSLDDSFMSEY